MRTRSRPVLQDKTPVNTPHKPNPKVTRSAKPQLVPVVEIKARLRQSSRVKHVEAAPSNKVDDEEVSGVQEPEDARVEEPSRNESQPERKAARPRRGTGRKGRVASRRTNEHQHPSTSRAINTELPRTVDHEEEHSIAEAHEADADERVAQVETLRAPPPVSPILQRKHASAPTAHDSTNFAPVPSLPSSSFRVSLRPSTPESIPVADDDSTASEAARAILNTPSPARIIRTPIPALSTPLGRLPPLEQSLRPPHLRGRHDGSIRNWHAEVTRASSPLPPSSPPPPSPPPQAPAAASSQPQPQTGQFSDEPDEDQENQRGGGGVYASKEIPSQIPSEDDLFGLLAAEKKLKTIRQRRSAIESSRVPGAAREPLGTLALDEVPSAVTIPDRLPTPIPSDDDHNIDDLYLDIDPVRSSPPPSDDFAGEDKENIPTEDYDLNEDKENMRPPHLVFDDFKENDPPADEELEEYGEDEENHPSVAPLLLASAKKALDELLVESSSSSASPTHALRTPHKHRSAHRRSPLPTPHFSDGGLSDSPLTARSGGMRNSSPSPVKPSVARPAPTAGPSKPRQPLATLELDDPEPSKVAGRKRTRAQAEESEGSDPRAVVRKLEALLPKRSKTRAMAAKKPREKAARGRGAASSKGKGKGRENVPESESESEEDSDSSPPKAPVRGARGRGRGASRGRGRGRAPAPAAAERSATARGRSTSRGRPASKGKGKEKAVEAIDPDEDEERARKRQERIEYFRKLQEYSLEKEDVYVI